MTIAFSTSGVDRVLDKGTAQVPMQSNDREARILASIVLGIEQAARGEGTLLSDEDLKSDDE